MSILVLSVRGVLPDNSMGDLQSLNYIKIFVIYYGDQFIEVFFIILSDGA